MRRSLIITLLLFPTLAFASCSPDKATVFYVNGINATKDQASLDATSLWRKYYLATGDDSTQFINAYNQTHGEVTDVYKTITQMLQWDPASWNEDTNGDAILNQIHDDLTTQKVMLVGHSQGAFYTNETYKYLTTHGVSTDAVKVFNVATPASYIAGNGQYITSINDTVINQARTLRLQPGMASLAEPLPGNAVLAVTSDDPKGHLFSATYLAQDAADIVKKIQTNIATLQPTSSDDLPSCFVAPNDSALHKVGVSFSNFGASAGTFAYLWGAGALNGSIAAVGSALDAAHQVIVDVGTAIGGANGLAHAGEPKYAPTNFDVANHIFSGDKQTVDGESVYDLLHEGGPALGGAVILATLQGDNQPAGESASTAPQDPSVPIGPAPGFSPGGGGVAAPEPQSTASSVSEDEDPAPSADTGTPTDTATSSDEIPDVVTPPFTPAPVLPGPEELATMTGFYCNEDTSVLLAGGSYIYRPVNNRCHYLPGPIGNEQTVEGILLKGAIGNSSIATRIVAGFGPNKNLETDAMHNYDFVGSAVSGQQFTVVLYHYNNNVGGQYNAYYVGDMLHYLETGLRNDGVTDTAPYEYQTLSFVIP